MAIKDQSALRIQAQIIKNETLRSANTALRVGETIEDIIDSIPSLGGGGGWEISGTTVVTSPEIDINGTTLTFSSDDGDTTAGIILRTDGTPVTFEMDISPYFQQTIRFDFAGSPFDNLAKWQYVAQDFVTDPPRYTLSLDHRGANEYPVLSAVRWGDTAFSFGAYRSEDQTEGYIFRADATTGTVSRFSLFTPDERILAHTNGDTGFVMYGGYVLGSNDNSMTLNLKGIGTTTDIHTAGILLWDSGNVLRGGMRVATTQGLTDSVIQFQVLADGGSFPLPRYEFNSTHAKYIAIGGVSDGLYPSIIQEFHSIAKVSGTSYDGYTRLKHTVSNDSGATPTFTISIEDDAGPEVDTVHFDEVNGMYYESDNSGTQTAGDRWIPDIGYNDGAYLIHGTTILTNTLVIETPTGPSLSLDSSSFKVDTDNVAGSETFLHSLDTSHYFRDYYRSNGSAISGLEIGPIGAALLWDDNGNPLQVGSLVQLGIDSSDGSFIVKDAENTKGLGYAADYSTNGISVWGNRWIPDKEYVDSKKESIQVAVSDEITDLTTGTTKLTFRMPYAFTLTDIRASVSTAPSGSTIIVDVNQTGSTILSTKLSIDSAEKTSTTAASSVVISDSVLVDDAEITIDIDQIGSTIAGTGLKVTLIGNQ